MVWAVCFANVAFLEPISSTSMNRSLRNKVKVMDQANAVGPTSIERSFFVVMLLQLEGLRTLYMYPCASSSHCARDYGDAPATAAGWDDAGCHGCGRKFDVNCVSFHISRSSLRQSLVAPAQLLQPAPGHRPRHLIPYIFLRTPTPTWDICPPLRVRV